MAASATEAVQHPLTNSYQDIDTCLRVVQERIVGHPAIGVLPGPTLGAKEIQVIADEITDAPDGGWYKEKYLRDRLDFQLRNNLKKVLGPEVFESPEHNVTAQRDQIYALPGTKLTIEPPLTLAEENNLRSHHTGADIFRSGIDNDSTGIFIVDSMARSAFGEDFDLMPLSVAEKIIELTNSEGTTDGK